MEQSAAEIVIEKSEVEVEAQSWEQKRTPEQLLGLIVRREAFLDSQGVEL